MTRKCIVCDEQAFSSLGGALLCQIHRAAVMSEIDALREAGKPVDATRIAYDMREPETPPHYAPSASAVHAFLRKHDISGSKAARMMYLSGSRQVRKYTGGESPRQMDGSRWFCLHAHTILPAEQIAMIEAAMEADLAGDA